MVSVAFECWVLEMPRLFPPPNPKATTESQCWNLGTLDWKRLWRCKTRPIIRKTCRKTEIGDKTGIKLAWLIGGKGLFADMFFPPLPGGSLDFTRVTSILLSFLPPLLPSPNNSQCALPALNCEFQIWKGTAGRQPRAPELSGHCPTDPNCECQNSVCTVGLQLRSPNLSG